MCLDKYETDKKLLAKLSISSSDSPLYKPLTYFIPDFYFSTVKILVQKLMEYGITKEKSDIMTYTSDICKLDLRINGEYEQALSAVFINPPNQKNHKMNGYLFPVENSLFQSLQKLPECNRYENLVNNARSFLMNRDHMTWRYFVKSSNEDPIATSLW